MSQLITQKATVILTGNSLQRRQHDGREYAVAPATIIVAGVLNGELVPAEELSEFAERWNGRPVPLRHPTDAAGNYISANSPDVIENAVLGQIFNAQFAEDRVKAEMWLDVAKIEKLGGDALTALERLDAGEVIEVSTGYYAYPEDGAGSFKGQHYSAIQRKLVPDHVALLPDEVGACSVADGCGAGRYNTQGLTANASDGVMLGFYLRDGDAQAMALGDVPDGVEVMPANSLHVTLAYLGKVDEVAIEEASLLEFASSFARGEVIVTTAVNGHGRFLNADENDGMEPVFAICQSEHLYRFRRYLVSWLSDWDCDIDRYHVYLPHVTLAYAPPGVDVPLQLARRELVFDALAVSWGGRTVTFPLQGDIREEMSVNKQEEQQAKVNPREPKNPKVKAAVDEQAKGVKANEEAVENGDPVAEPVAEPTTDPVVEVDADMAALSGILAEFGGAEGLRDALSAIKTNTAQQKAQAISRITANRNNAFSKADLDAMPLEQVLKLDRTLSPADYSGAGGYATNAGDDEWKAYEAPKAG